MTRKTFFIKMNRCDESLEKLIEVIRGNGCEVVEMSARSSLDNSCFFVHLSVQGNGSSEGIEGKLGLLSGVRQIEPAAAQ